MEAQRFVPPISFEPAAGFVSPHAQTLAAFILRPRRVPAVDRRRWATPDGDFIDVDILPAPPASPHVLILHGLEGSTRAGYVAAILEGAAQRGWGAVAMNFRHCSGPANLLLQSYHAGHTADPLHVLRRLEVRAEGPLFAVGFSIGANVLLRMLVELARDCPLAAAVAISPPFDLSLCAQRLDRGRGWTALYRRYFLWSLRRKALHKSRRHPGSLNPWRVLASRRFFQFDDTVTAALHGFADVNDYYARVSCGRVLQSIRTPTLIVAAQDDPMIPASSITFEALQNPHITAVLPEHGGHMGFVAGSMTKPTFWGETTALKYLDHQLALAQPTDANG